MLMEVKKEFKLMLVSVKYALMREMLNKVTFFSNIIFMILNNASFIIQWVILYSIKDNVGGYSFNQVMILWALASFSFGISHFFFKRAFNLSSIIMNGSLDNYLVQPKNVLLSSITSDIDVSAIGDIIYGLIVYFIFGFSIETFFLFLLFGITSSIIITCFAIIMGSLSFWFTKSEGFADRMNNMITNFATYPEGIFRGIIKTILYTIIPLGIVSYIPIQVLSEFDLIKLLIIIGSCILFIVLAFVTFNRGLKRYSSTNLMIARI